MTATCTYVSKKSAVSCDLNGETVILDAHSGKYFALDPVGTEVWQLVQTPATLAQICEKLMLSYDVPADRCFADVSGLIDSLVQNGLVEPEEEWR
jgi:hypothetical protein